LTYAAGEVSFLHRTIEAIRSGEGVFFKDEFRSPIFIEDQCSLIRTILRDGRTGIYHCAGGQRLSRHDFAALVAEVFDLPVGRVRPGILEGAQLPAPRPRDVSLQISKARTELGFEPTPVLEALKQIRANV
jgi:dTDP-4-dehydrorhamnose reductase